LFYFRLLETLKRRKRLTNLSHWCRQLNSMHTVNHFLFREARILRFFFSRKKCIFVSSRQLFFAPPCLSQQGVIHLLKTSISLHICIVSQKLLLLLYIFLFMWECFSQAESTLSFAFTRSDCHPFDWNCYRLSWLTVEILSYIRKNAFIVPITT